MVVGMGMERLSKETRMAGVMVGSRDVSGRGDISGREEQMEQDVQLDKMPDRSLARSLFPNPLHSLHKY